MNKGAYIYLYMLSTHCRYCRESRKYRVEGKYTRDSPAPVPYCRVLQRAPAPAASVSASSYRNQHHQRAPRPRLSRCQSRPSIVLGPAQGRAVPLEWNDLPSAHRHSWSLVTRPLQPRCPSLFPPLSLFPLPLPSLRQSFAISLISLPLSCSPPPPHATCSSRSFAHSCRPSSQLSSAGLPAPNVLSSLPATSYREREFATNSRTPPTNPAPPQSDPACVCWSLEARCYPTRQNEGGLRFPGRGRR